MEGQKPSHVVLDEAAEEMTAKILEFPFQRMGKSATAAREEMKHFGDVYSSRRDINPHANRKAHAKIRSKNKAAKKARRKNRGN